MKNKKIDILFWLVIVAFMLVTVVSIKGFESKMTNNFNDYSLSITSIVKGKNDTIVKLSNQLAIRENENQDLRNTLADTRNKLEALTRNLTQPESK